MLRRIGDALGGRAGPGSQEQQTLTRQVLIAKGAFRAASEGWHDLAERFPEDTSLAVYTRLVAQEADVLLSALHALEGVLMESGGEEPTGDLEVLLMQLTETFHLATDKERDDNWAQAASLAALAACVVELFNAIDAD